MTDIKPPNQTRAVAEAGEPQVGRINRHDRAEAGVAAAYDPRRNLTPAQARVGRILQSLAKRTGVPVKCTGADLMAAKGETLSQDIESWDLARCRDAWIAMNGAAPGSRLSLRFLRKALIFELQCKELGGHSAAIRRLLRAGVGGVSARVQVLTPGSQLVREWNGRVYRVKITADGFEMDGQSYSSLSAVARRITGAERSGPRFFGLRKCKP